MRQSDFPNSMAQAGPICKKAEDLVPILKVLVGEKVSLLKLDTPVNVKTLNIFYQENSGDIRASKVNSEMRAALLKAVHHLKEITGSVTKVCEKFIKNLYKFNCYKVFLIICIYYR